MKYNGVDDKIHLRKAEESSNGRLLPTLERQKVRSNVARIISSFGYCVYSHSDMKNIKELIRSI
jgi:hypothetical protein